MTVDNAALDSPELSVHSGSDGAKVASGTGPVPRGAPSGR